MSTESFPDARRRETDRIVTSIGTLATFMRDTDPLTVHQTLEEIEEALQTLRAKVLPPMPERIVAVHSPSEDVQRFEMFLWGTNYAELRDPSS